MDQHDRLSGSLQLVFQLEAVDGCPLHAMLYAFTDKIGPLPL
jgi:hypothetical protein